MENIINLFKKGFDWLYNFYKRFQAVGFTILLIALIFSFIGNGCKKQYAVELAEKLLKLDIEKDLVEKKYEEVEFEKNNIAMERDSLEGVNETLVKQRDRAIVDKYEANRTVARYRKENRELLEALKYVSSDSSYQFLDQEAYPFPGPKEYGFNARQVSGIHHTYVENEGNLKRIDAMEIELDHCETALEASLRVDETSDEMYTLAEEELEKTEEMDKLSRESARISEKKVQLFKDEQKREKFWKGFWKVTTVVAFAAGLAL